MRVRTHRLRARAALCLALCLAGCSRGHAAEPAPAHALTPTRSPLLRATVARPAPVELASRDLSSPIEASLGAREAPRRVRLASGAAVLRETLWLEVRHASGLALALVVQLRIPAGVALVEGLTQTTLAAGRAGETQSLRYVIEYDRVPDEDLEVELDAQSGASGVHATLAHRFGREEPARVRPARGAPVRNGARVVAEPIEL